MISTALFAAAPTAGAEDPDEGSGFSDIATSLLDKASNYDSRLDPQQLKVLLQKAARIAADPKAGVVALRDALGTQAVVSIDPLTETARSVSRLDGLLTGPDARPAAEVALSYVGANPDVFGLDAAEIGGLVLRRDYQDIEGTHHLSFIQSVAGIPVFGNGLQANVTSDGRIINVIGSPVAELPTTAGSPAIDAVAARAAAIASLEVAVPDATAVVEGGPRQTTVFSNGDRAELAYFVTGTGLQLAWQTQTAPSSKALYSSIVEASSGKVLYRNSLVNSDNADPAEGDPSSDANVDAPKATAAALKLGKYALAWSNYPGAPRGGSQQLRDFAAAGWVAPNSPILSGNVAHVFSDINDNDVAEPSEEVAARVYGQFLFPFKKFNSADARCSAQIQCSWDPNKPYSWKANRAQNATQLMYFLGKIHDHLAAAPIGFTRAAGNFEAVDGDAVDAQSMDGANTANGLPDFDHVDNANMSTPPDGQSPTMQMYLFPTPGEPLDPFIPSNSGDEADIVYHEYTHGLSNRLVVDALGNSTLSGQQAGAMGEAWSDWYAYDFLANQGLQPDTTAPGEVRVGQYVGAGQDLIRTQPLDCPVGTDAAACPGSEGAGPGGYTYGDYGTVIGGPEVHADGEIWAETLWDLRTALGSSRTESLVTRAMELSAANPSFLDMRNSIVLADLVTTGGANVTTIWTVFAARGMGWFAGAVDGDDTTPIEDFSLPPAPGTPTGTLSGTVTNQDTAAPLEGVAVGFGGHASGFPGDYAALTAADGSYTIDGILPGTYPAVFARGAGYDRQIDTVSIAARDNTHDFALRRDWAALSGGGSIADFTGPDYTEFGCGPVGAIDQSTGTGWGSTTDLVDGVATPKYVTIALPEAVDIGELAVDPSATCGDGGSASTGAYRIETSTDGQTFAVAAEGEFTPDDRSKLVPVELEAGTTNGVTHVRFTMIAPQLPGDPAVLCPGPYSGCDYLDMTELEVFGVPAA